MSEGVEGDAAPVSALSEDFLKQKRGPCEAGVIIPSS